MNIKNIKTFEFFQTRAYLQKYEIAVVQIEIFCYRDREIATSLKLLRNMEMKSRFFYVCAVRSPLCHNHKFTNTFGFIFRDKKVFRLDEYKYTILINNLFFYYYRIYSIYLFNV